MTADTMLWPRLAGNADSLIRYRSEPAAFLLRTAPRLDRPGPAVAGYGSVVRMTTPYPERRRYQFLTHEPQDSQAGTVNGSRLEEWFDRFNVFYDQVRPSSAGRRARIVRLQTSDGCAGAKTAGKTMLAACAESEL
jgi:hypothetical protein